MKKELDDKLCQAFPNLYAARHKDMTEASMCWGFQCSDGWFDLIWNLSEKLEKLILELPDDQKQICRASTVKEKFGVLRFYMKFPTEKMEKLIEEFEEKSMCICEECGKVGTQRETGSSWYYVACEEHIRK